MFSATLLYSFLMFLTFQHLYTYFVISNIYIYKQYPTFYNNTSPIHTCNLLHMYQLKLEISMLIVQ